MAYLYTIDHPKCGRSGCEKPATVILRNAQNADINWYCDRHKDAALTEFRRGEL